MLDAFIHLPFRVQDAYIIDNFYKPLVLDQNH